MDFALQAARAVAQPWAAGMLSSALVHPPPPTEMLGPVWSMLKHLPIRSRQCPGAPRESAQVTLAPVRPEDKPYWDQPHLHGDGRVSLGFCNAQNNRRTVWGGL